MGRVLVPNASQKQHSYWGLFFSEEYQNGNPIRAPSCNYQRDHGGTYTKDTCRDSEHDKEENSPLTSNHNAKSRTDNLKNANQRRERREACQAHDNAIRYHTAFLRQHSCHGDGAKGRRDETNGDEISEPQTQLVNPACCCRVGIHQSDPRRDCSPQQPRLLHRADEHRPQRRKNPDNAEEQTDGPKTHPGLPNWVGPVTNHGGIRSGRGAIGAIGAEVSRKNGTARQRERHGL
ncbi:hypothetical protein CFAM422_000669 [Trichoderma lentiforme]|uniref:Uncharacterized protein n=1 Tax=Trichoderma lentiforme TaxID=1567552 RepID=A0A9P4XRU8_9HYPO|nr:hypothetical protein CFAM422_000669 [Trichoderma lentiforme]